MATDIRQPVVRVPFVTSNGVRIIVESYPKSIQNNRGRTVALDFDTVYTNIDLDIGETHLNPSLVSGISELEDDDTSEGGIRESALHHFHNDVRNVCRALNAESNYEALISTVFNTRNEVLNQRGEA